MMHVINVMALAMEVMDIVFCDEGDNKCVRCNGDGNGSDGHCFRVEIVMQVINEMAMMMEIIIALRL